MAGLVDRNIKLADRMFTRDPREKNLDVSPEIMAGLSATVGHTYTLVHYSQ